MTWGYLNLHTVPPKFISEISSTASHSRYSILASSGGSKMGRQKSIRPGVHFGDPKNGPPERLRTRLRKLDRAGCIKFGTRFRIRLAGRFGGQNSSPRIQDTAAGISQNGQQLFQNWCGKTSKAAQKKCKNGPKKVQKWRGPNSRIVDIPIGI